MPHDDQPAPDPIAILARARCLGFALWRVAPALHISRDALRRLEPRIRSAAPPAATDDPASERDRDRQH